MEQRTALVFGATGLVGNLILEELVGNKSYSEIRIFVRGSAGLNEPKVKEIITDFDNLQAVEGEIAGDDLFICLGTTIKKAGSVRNMERIDRDLPLAIAGAAMKNGIRSIAAVSSIGASATSANYYLRIKGEMEEGLLNSGHKKVIIVRPSLLLGERREKRTGEAAGKVFMKVFNPLLFGKLLKYRAIHGRDVARAMIWLTLNSNDSVVAESDELQRLSKLQAG